MLIRHKRVDSRLLLPRFSSLSPTLYQIEKVFLEVLQRNPRIHYKPVGCHTGPSGPYC